MQDTLIIDVREPHEFKEFHIKDSVHAPLSNPNTQNLENLIKNSKQDKIILMCLSGRRAQMTKDSLKNNFGKEIIVYQGGIRQWEKENDVVRENEEKKVEVPDLNRQVQMFVGFILLMITAFSLINPLVSLASAFIGLGLIYSGISGSCMMASLLNKMPWNQKG
jgi:rhodanese-related sulfurtransferase